MGIFSEVGKIILEEADGNGSGIPAGNRHDGTAALPDGEVVMDGEDMLNVVHINHIVPEPEASSGQAEKVPAGYGEDDLSFWEVPRVSADIPEAGKAPEEKKIPGTGKSPETLLPSTENAITGNIIFPADATVRADIAGNVKAEGTLTVEGTITGNVEAGDVVLRGVIRGSLKCRKLTLLPVTSGNTGYAGSRMSSVEGYVTAEALVTDLM